MFFIAAAFYYLNRADQDCGTTFAWVTRAMGPQAGWIAGWAVCMTGILVIGSLADVAVFTFFQLIDAESLVKSTSAVTIGAVLLIVLMTTICVIGTEASARLQVVLMALQIIPLLIFVTVVLWKVFAGDGPGTSVEPNLSWFNPLNIESTSVLVSSLLLGMFIYWGWESAVNLNEETAGDVKRPGLAGLISTLILLVTYVGVATAVLAWRGIGGAASFDDNPGILGKYATGALGDPTGKIVLLAIVVSALASTQTTILPAARTSLSMARHEAIPDAFGEVSKRFFTPLFSTVAIGVLAIAWYVPGKLINENFLFDSITALGLMIAFYYAFTGFACVIYYRREIPKSVRNFLFIGLAPFARRGDTQLPLRQGAVQLRRPGQLLHRERMVRRGAARRDRRRHAAARRGPAVRLAALQARAVLQAPARGRRPEGARGSPRRGRRSRVSPPSAQEG